jgi:hypothetical protein
MMGARFHGFSSVSDNGLYVNLFGGFPEYSEAILLQFESEILEFRMPFPFQAACERCRIGRDQEP